MLRVKKTRGINMREIKAIETVYKGYRFRSRLEARWAVFFDACGVKWEYEPEGYDLGNGLCYLPDFLLHNVTVHHGTYRRGCDIYVEVKGVMTDEAALKIKRFAESGMPEEECDLSKTPVLVVGNIPDGETIYGILDSLSREAYNDHGEWPNFYNFETVDGDYFAAYPGVDRNGYFELFGDDSGYLSYMDNDKTLQAYTLARQARFEFGETPAVRRFR
jgi:hypothetical protein